MRLALFIRDAENELRRPFMMPAFAVNKLTKPSAATVQLAVAEAPATTVSERSPMAPTTMGLPGVEEDVFGEFADGGEHKEVAGATEDDGFGEFAAGTPDPTAAETSGSIDFGEPESVPAFEIKAPAIEAIPPVTEEAEAGAAIAVSSGAVAAEGGNAASLLDDMLGAALCGESIAPKKPSARTAPTTVACVCPIVFPKPSLSSLEHADPLLRRRIPVDLFSWTTLHSTRSCLCSTPWL